MPNNKSLIGFVGGPWTLSKYAFGNKDSDLIDTKINLEFISKVLLPLLKKNIQLQLDAGVELVMVFDSSLLDLDKINIRGGALSRGHPIGASGAILVVRLFNELIKKPETFGMAAIAAAGGIGSAMMLKS